MKLYLLILISFILLCFITKREFSCKKKSDCTRKEYEDLLSQVKEEMCNMSSIYKRFGELELEEFKQLYPNVYEFKEDGGNKSPILLDPIEDPFPEYSLDLYIYLLSYIVGKYPNEMDDDLIQFVIKTKDNISSLMVKINKIK